MLAIPVFRDRVAPVFDWCSRIIIVPEEGDDIASYRQIVVRENTFKLMRKLWEQGAKTVICGALSPEALNYGQSIGLRIIHGIAGDIEEVLGAYHDQKLDQPQYWLPGCKGPRRYKSLTRCAGKGVAKGSSEENQSMQGKSRGRRSSDSPSGRKGADGFAFSCICPRCGARREHDRGIPCSQVQCPSCHSAMMRE